MLMKKMEVSIFMVILFLSVTASFLRAEDGFSNLVLVIDGDVYLVELDCDTGEMIVNNVIDCGGRAWGVRYHENRNGDIVVSLVKDEIDYQNFFCNTCYKKNIYSNNGKYIKAFSKDEEGYNSINTGVYKILDKTVYKNENLVGKIEDCNSYTGAVVISSNYMYFTETPRVKGMLGGDISKAKVCRINLDTLEKEILFNNTSGVGIYKIKVYGKDRLVVSYADGTPGFGTVKELVCNNGVWEENPLMGENNAHFFWAYNDKCVFSPYPIDESGYLNGAMEFSEKFKIFSFDKNKVIDCIYGSELNGLTEAINEGKSLYVKYDLY